MCFGAGHDGVVVPWFALVVALAGCQVGAEVDFVRPNLARPAPVAVRETGGLTQLELGLLGVPNSWLLVPEDRVVVGGQVFRLNSLKKDDFTLSNLMVAGATPLAASPVALRYYRRKTPLRLVLVMDASESAASNDPQASRVAATRRLVEAVDATCQQAGLLCDTEVGLVVLGDDHVQVLVQPTADRSQAHAALDSVSPKGRAPLWDGLVEAAGQLKGSAGVLLLYWASAQDGGSKATADQAQAALLQQPPVTLVSICGPGGEQGELLPLHGLNDGFALQAKGGAGIDEAFTAVATALPGWWALELAPKASSAPGSQLSGTVALELFGQRWTASFGLPLLGP
jgi:hypothetical protein